MTNSKNQDKEINKFLNIEYLKAISTYPIEIIALLPLTGAIAFGYKFFKSDTQIIYLSYSLLFFLVAVLALIYVHREKNRKITDQFIASPINFYPTMSEVKTAIDNIFDKMSANSEITQTYIKNNFLAGSQDVIFKDAFVNIQDTEEKPTVNRIFILFDPLDINFAEHSYEMSHGVSMHNHGDYGGNLNNIYISSSGGEKIANIIPNITMIDGKVLVTFPSRTTKHYKFPKKLVESPAGNSTKGIEVKSNDFYNEYKNYLTNTQSEGLDRIKCQFFKQDKTAYYYSIIFSIAKELLHDKNLTNNILYLGIVGSLANCVENKENYIDPDNINDLDLQIIFRDLTSDHFQKSKKICAHVCKRFCIENVVNFYVETNSTPVKSSKFSSGIPQIPIHLLLSDRKSCKNLDKFIAVDRVQHAGNVTFEWVLKNNKDNTRQHNELKALVKASLKDGSIRFNDLISDKYFYSLSACLRVLEKSNPKLKIKKWKHEKDDEYILEDIEQELSPIEIANFAKYTLKWGVINFFNAAENYNINKNSYSRDFIYAINQIKQTIPNIDDVSLINIFNMQDSEISANEINLIVENIKTIENYIESKIT